MVKYALLVGINYLLTPSMRLYGSYNDVLLMNDFLIKFAGYSVENILILTDIDDIADKFDQNDQSVVDSYLNKNIEQQNPVDTSDNTTEDSQDKQLNHISYLNTRNSLYGSVGEHPNNLNATFMSIVKTIKELLLLITENDSLFIYFNGHGGQIKDNNNDEIDGKDELFFPSDFSRHSITDDLLRSLINDSKTKSTIYFMFDCCNSGSAVDLKYKYDIHKNILIEKLESKDGPKSPEYLSKVISISACDDDQSVFEQVFEYKNLKKIHGQFTYTFVEIMKDRITQIVTPTVKDIYKQLKMKAFTSKSILEIENLDLLNAVFFSDFHYETKQEKKEIRSIISSNNITKITSKYEEVYHNNKKLKKKIAILNERLNAYIQLYGNNTTMTFNFNNLRFSSILNKRK